MSTHEASDSVSFAPSEPLTLGVEVEVQLLDETTLDLSPQSPAMLEKLSSFGDRVKAEIFQSMLEFNTGICKTAHEVREDLAATMDAAEDAAKSLGLRLASAGTHPFADYADRKIYPGKRYKALIERNQWIARRLMIFGLHVHVGMRSGDHAILMSNAVLHYLPILLALSASSPYWRGVDTELASSRITFFEASPIGGRPCEVRSWNEFAELYARLVKADAIRSPKDLWWDIRPSPEFGTIEFRICDGLATLEETAALTALIHSLCVFIDQQLEEGRRFEPPPDWIMRENKWRASRWGVECELIVDTEGNTAALPEIVESLFETLAPISERLHYEPFFATIRDILKRGQSSRRQRAVARAASGDLRAVADFNAREFSARVPLWEGGFED